jgi:hypothetical protein
MDLTIKAALCAIQDAITKFTGVFRSACYRKNSTSPFSRGPDSPFCDLIVIGEHPPQKSR